MKSLFKNFLLGLLVLPLQDKTDWKLESFSKITYLIMQIFLFQKDGIVHFACLSLLPICIEYIIHVLQ